MRLEALANELRMARTQGLRVRAVRISYHAIPGSITALPISEERRRRLGICDGRYVEVLCHPDDWVELLEENEELAEALEVDPDHLTRIFGIPVLLEDRRRAR